MANDEIFNLHQFVLSGQWIGNPTAVFRTVARYQELREQSHSPKAYAEFGTLYFWDAYYEIRESGLEVEEEMDKAAIGDFNEAGSSSPITLEDLQVIFFFLNSAFKCVKNFFKSFLLILFFSNLQISIFLIFAFFSIFHFSKIFSSISNFVENFMLGIAEVLFGIDLKWSFFFALGGCGIGYMERPAFAFGANLRPLRPTESRTSHHGIWNS